MEPFRRAGSNTGLAAEGIAAWTAWSPGFPGQNMAGSGYDYIASHEPMRREPINAR